MEMVIPWQLCRTVGPLLREYETKSTKILNRVSHMHDTRICGIQGFVEFTELVHERYLKSPGTRCGLIFQYFSMGLFFGNVCYTEQDK